MTKVGSSYQDCCIICRHIPQRSTLGPVLFNISLVTTFVFLKKTDESNFVEDNSLYSCKNVLLL